MGPLMELPRSCWVRHDAHDPVRAVGTGTFDANCSNVDPPTILDLVVGNA